VTLRLTQVMLVAAKIYHPGHTAAYTRLIDISLILRLSEIPALHIQIVAR